MNAPDLTRTKVNRIPTRPKRSRSPVKAQPNRAKRLECARIPALLFSSFFSPSKYSEHKSYSAENPKRRNTAHSKRFARSLRIIKGLGWNDSDGSCACELRPSPLGGGIVANFSARGTSRGGWFVGTPRLFSALAVGAHPQ